MIVDPSALLTVFLALVSGMIQMAMLLRGRQMIASITPRLLLLASGSVTLYVAIPYLMLANGAPLTISPAYIRPAINALLISSTFLAAFTHQYYRSVEVIREASQERRRLRLLQEQLVNIVFHELRTPLTGILAYTEMVFLRDVEATDDELLRGIRRSGKRLQLMIEQAAALRRTVDIMPFDVVEMIRSLLEGELVWIATRKMPGQLHLAYEGNDSLIIEGDRAKLNTAVLELVRNAVKATREGGRVVVGTTVLNGDYVIFVSDTGPGIEEETLRGLLTGYALDFVDMTDTRPYEGSGLGLAVVRHVVKLHGGKIEAESEVGAGSTFRIKLPRYE
jgi:signal transduction histidine kinase